MRKTIS